MPYEGAIVMIAFVKHFFDPSGYIIQLLSLLEVLNLRVNYSKTYSGKLLVIFNLNKIIHNMLKLLQISVVVPAIGRSSRRGHLVLSK